MFGLGISELSNYCDCDYITNPKDYPKSSELLPRIIVNSNNLKQA